MEHIDVLNPDVTAAIEDSTLYNRVIDYTEKIGSADSPVRCKKVVRNELELQMEKLKFFKGKIKEYQTAQKAVEAMIQSQLLQELENKNLKFAELETEVGTASLAYKQKTKIDDAKLLREIFGSMLDDKVERKIKVTVDFTDKDFEQALVALYFGNYGARDLDVMLFGLGLDDKQIKVLMKKFKGEYKHDSALLESVGFDPTEMEEELDMIHDHKQWERVERFFGDAQEIDRAKLKRALYVDETLAFGTKFNAAKDEADEDSTM